MTNKKLNKKSKWLKLALISTATISMLATIPAAICAKKVNKEISSLNTSAPVLSELKATGYIRLTFKIREDDKDTQVAPAATLTGPTVVKMRKGGYFGTAQKPTADRQGYDFLGWSENENYSSSENILNDGSVIEGNTTLYAVFSKVKMTVYFPESTDGDYQWTYDGATNDEEKKISVRFQKDDTLSKITCPTPKWKVPDETAPVVKVWDGKWYKNQPGSTQGDPIGATEVLSPLDGKNIYPGWKDVEAHNIVIKGNSVVSSNELNIEYTATVYPEGTSQLVDWYTCDAVNTPSVPSTKAEISNEEGHEGELTVKNVVNSSFFVFALAKGSTIPATISTNDPNVIQVTAIDPTEDSDFSNKIIATTTNEDTKHPGRMITYSIDPEEFYKLGEANDEVLGLELGEKGNAHNIGKRSDFSLPIAFGKNVPIIKDGFMPSGISADNQPIGFANFDANIKMTNVTNIGADFLLDNPTFNHDITLPETLLTIGSKFLSGLASFKQSITFGGTPSILSIGNKFLQGSKKFASALELPESLVHVGEYFLYNCTGLNKDDIIITIKCKPSAFADSTASFAVDKVTGSVTSHKINVTCAKFDDLKLAFPNENDDLLRELVKKE